MWKETCKFSNTKPGLLVCLVIVIGLIFIAKSAAWLQSGELAILDLFFQVRPQEPVDKRIIIINYTENDIKKFGEPSVSDRNLAILLNKVKQQNPAVIGLDIIRDQPVAEGYEELAEVFKTTPNLIGIQNVGLENPILPPPILKELGQVSTVDTFIDGDRKVRRSLIYPWVEGSEDTSNLGLRLAFEYLETKGISQKSDPDDFLKLGEITIFPLKENDGGYSNIDAGGYQILTNYRGPSGSFATVTFTDVMTNALPSTLMTDRIVLIGVSATSGKDFFFTPYSQNQTTPELMTGVELNANITSQIVAAVLDRRPLFWFIPNFFEILGSLLLLTITIVLIWVRKPHFDSLSAKFLIYVAGLLVTIITVVFGLCYLAFLYGVWLPVLFPVLCVLGVTFSTTGFIYINGIHVSHSVLKQKNKLLQGKQTQLENSYQVVQQQSLALENSETNLILALDAAITGIWNWDLKSGKICITHNCHRLLGGNQDNLTISFAELLERVYPEDHELLRQTVDKIIKDTLKCSFKFRVVWDNERIHRLAVEGKVTYDPVTSQPVKMIGTISDVTRRILEEEKEAGSCRWENALIENSFEINMTLDENLFVIFVSKAIKRILSYERQDIEGRNFLEFIHPDDIDRFKNAIKEKLTEPESTALVKYKFRNKGGEDRNIESVIYNQLHHPSVRAYVINLHDTTEYEEIKHSLREIENSVQRLIENNDNKFYGHFTALNLFLGKKY